MPDGSQLCRPPRLCASQSACKRQAQTGFPARPSAKLQTVSGGRLIESSGGTPRYAPTSTSASCPVQPWLRVEEGRSAVSTFGFPCRQNPGSAGSGSYQAPVDNCATPGRTASSTASPARQTPRVVEDPYEVPVAQPASRRVGGVHPHRFPPGDLDRLAMRADVQLAVQPGPRLVGDQLQTEAPSLDRA